MGWINNVLGSVVFNYEVWSVAILKIQRQVCIQIQNSDQIKAFIMKASQSVLFAALHRTVGGLSCSRSSNDFPQVISYCKDAGKTSHYSTVHRGRSPDALVFSRSKSRDNRRAISRFGDRKY